MAGYNPIDKVGTKLSPDGTIADGVTLPPPTSYQYKWEDVSDSSAGRTEDMEMHKNRKGRVAGLDLGWERVKISDCSKIIKAFKPEYVYIRYLDAETGAFETRLFYTGPGTAPLFNTKTGKWDSLSFQITTKGNVL